MMEPNSDYHVIYAPNVNKARSKSRNTDLGN